MDGLFVVVLWPMILPVAVLHLFDVSASMIAPIMLIWDLIVLAALLLARYLWKKSGTMDRSFLDQRSGWKRRLLILLRYGLLLAIVWEVLLVLFCGAYLFWWPSLLGT